MAIRAKGAIWQTVKNASQILETQNSNNKIADNFEIAEKRCRSEQRGQFGKLPQRDSPQPLQLQTSHMLQA